MDWLAVERIETPRLVLEPLRVAHADELQPLLDDQRLYRFIGGSPPTLEELRHRHERQVVGHSPDGTRGWLNWVVRNRSTDLAVGTVQATLEPESAEIAWLIGTDHQGAGYAKEASAGMVGWLQEHGIHGLTAHIHPGNHASIGVARHLGLKPDGTRADGELRWAAGTP